MVQQSPLAGEGETRLCFLQVGKYQAVQCLAVQFHPNPASVASRERSTVTSLTCAVHTIIVLQSAGITLNKLLELNRGIE